MTNKATKYGLMTIVAVLLVAMAFAGAGAATDVTIIFNGTSGIGDEYPQIIPSGTSTPLYPVGSNFTAPAGKAFVGWATENNTKVVYLDNASVELTADTKLFAVWNTILDADWTLSEDISLTDNIVVPVDAAVVIDLNGHTLKGNGNGSVIVNYGTLTVRDSIGGGNITNGHAAMGGGIFTTGTFTLVSGTIDGCTAGEGGGVYTLKEFFMNGGTITNCSGTNNGGAVWIGKDCRFIMSDGFIGTDNVVVTWTDSTGGTYDEFAHGRWVKDIVVTKGCYSPNGTAIYIGSTGYAEMNGGRICGCQANGYWGVTYIGGGTFKMTGGIIEKVKSTGDCNGAISGCGGTFIIDGGVIREVYGHGICTCWGDDGKIQMNGGIIERCNGCGICADGWGLNDVLCDVDITGGLIQDCYSSRFGGAMEIWGRQDVAHTHHLNITDFTIKNCTAGQQGGGIMMYGCFVDAKISNLTIENCTAGQQGGGIRAEGNLEISDSSITNCTAGTNGGGLWIHSSNTVVKIKGDVTISSNKKGDETNNVYIGGTNLMLVGDITGDIGVVYPVSSQFGTSDGKYSGVDCIHTDDGAYVAGYDGSKLVWKFYSVEFNANGGEGAMLEQAFSSSTESKNLAPNEFIKYGYLFEGWSTTPIGAVEYADEAVYENTSAVKDSTDSLYANWTVYSSTNSTMTTIGSAKVATFDDAGNVVKIVAIQNATSDVNTVTVAYEPDTARPSSDGSYTRTALTTVFNITITGNLGSDTANIVFNLTTAQLNGASPESIYLAHMKNGAWEYLKPTYVQTGDVYTFTVTGVTSFSPFVPISMTAIPQPTYTSSSSKQTGSTVILQEGQVAPTAYATVAPTVAPTAAPTEQPATPTVIATEKPTTQATQQSPAPFVGLLAGLGAAAVLLRLRK